MASRGMRWPPDVDDYVYVSATGDLATVVEVIHAADGPLFVVDVYPRPAGVHLPMPTALMERRTCQLDELAPEPPLAAR